ncbi:hypothetical protein ASG14_00035 [Pedobacter sp. Leaf194]|nr:hypothetical protein ASG14_00035 [Pedobacter sp. Leaf194]
MANVENNLTIRQKKYCAAFKFRKAGFCNHRLGFVPLFTPKKAEKAFVFRCNRVYFTLNFTDVLAI